jgi:D-3-phosphoglycerate dehydrogenase
LIVLDDPSPQSIRDHCREADGLLNTYTPIDETTLLQLENCKVIARYGIGVDNIDLRAAGERGVVVTNVPDYCLDEVADHTLALLLTVTRKIARGNEVTTAGGWGVDTVRPIHRLRDRSLGLVGFGNIARRVAARARAFALHVRAYDPYVPAEQIEEAGVVPISSMHELLGISDIVSVHVPLMEATRALIDATAIGAMPPGSILLNTSRGPIIDTTAVFQELWSGHLGGAGLDVFMAEPPDASELKDVPNLVVTPHVAFYSEESIEESQTKAARCVVDVLNGTEPAYRVA